MFCKIARDRFAENPRTRTADKRCDQTALECAQPIPPAVRAMSASTNRPASGSNSGDRELTFSAFKKTGLSGGEKSVKKPPPRVRPFHLPPNEKRDDEFLWSLVPANRSKIDRRCDQCPTDRPAENPTAFVFGPRANFRLWFPVADLDRGMILREQKPHCRVA